MNRVKQVKQELEALQGRPAEEVSAAIARMTADLQREYELQEEATRKMRAERGCAAVAPGDETEHEGEAEIARLGGILGDEEIEEMRKKQASLEEVLKVKKQAYVELGIESFAMLQQQKLFMREKLAMAKQKLEMREKLAAARRRLAEAELSKQ